MQDDIRDVVSFNPNLKDVDISINIKVDGMTSVYTIDHQTWPTKITHNGVEHVFDETSSIRLDSIMRTVLPVPLPYDQMGRLSLCRGGQRS